MSYSGKDIVVLEGLEAVRKRPGMYIGSTGRRGLHHMIWEICVEAHRDGHIYIDEYRDGGKPVTKLEKGNLLPVVGNCAKSKTGTKVTFYPDDEIFETVEFKTDLIVKKLKEIAYLNRGLRIIFKDERTGEEQEFYEEEGIVSYIRYINRDVPKLHQDIIYIEGKSSDIEVEIAFQYTTDYTEQINSYCNRINLADGGTLVTGFKTALTKIMNQYAREIGVLKEYVKNAILDGEIANTFEEADKFMRMKAAEMGLVER